MPELDPLDRAAADALELAADVVIMDEEAVKVAFADMVIEAEDELNAPLTAMAAPVPTVWTVWHCEVAPGWWASGVEGSPCRPFVRPGCV